MVLNFTWRSSNLQKPKRTRLLFSGWCLGNLFIQDLALNFARSIAIPQVLGSIVPRNSRYSTYSVLNINTLLQHLASLAIIYVTQFSSVYTVSICPRLWKLAWHSSNLQNPNRTRVLFGLCLMWTELNMDINVRQSAEHERNKDTVRFCSVWRRTRTNRTGPQKCSARFVCLVSHLWDGLFKPSFTRSIFVKASNHKYRSQGRYTMRLRSSYGTLMLVTCMRIEGEVTKKLA
jgi:hypothetical protein